MLVDFKEGLVVKLLCSNQEFHFIMMIMRYADFFLCVTLIFP
jgi:hypothetical protein